MTAQLNRTRNKRLNYKAHPSVLVAIAVVSLTSTIGYRFYNAPKLDVGTIAPETLFAPDDARVEDTKSTEERRKQERTGVIPVLMLNQVVNQEIYRELYNLLSRGTQLRLSAGTLSLPRPHGAFHRNSALPARLRRVGMADYSPKRYARDAPKTPRLQSG
uniref:Uncharacterized protein n=1 Tax=Desertifilum tharense IPPAS B-1220 TaxID=1781255 RepID=A0ACD5GXL2_9CYAN